MSEGNRAWVIVADATTPETPIGPFYESAAVVAREVLLFDRSEPEYHLLFAELQWQFASSTPEAFDMDRAQSAFAAATCGKRLAERSGDSLMLLRADTLLGWIGPFVPQQSGERETVRWM